MLKTSGAVPIDFEVEHIKGLERGPSRATLRILPPWLRIRGGVGLPRCALRELRRLHGDHPVLVGRVGIHDIRL